MPIPIYPIVFKVKKKYKVKNPSELIIITINGDNLIKIKRPYGDKRQHYTETSIIYIMSCGISSLKDFAVKKRIKTRL